MKNFKINQVVIAKVENGPFQVEVIKARIEDLKHVNGIFSAMLTTMDFHNSKSFKSQRIIAPVTDLKEYK